MSKVIFEKKYPNDELEEYKALFKTDATEIKESFTGQEIMEKLHKNLVYILLPERQKSAKEFIKIALDISESYEIDIKINKHPSHISVNYYFNSSSVMGFLKRVIKYADDISFFTNTDGYDIIMSIDHYTHAEYRNGRLMMPIPLE